MTELGTDLMGSTGDEPALQKGEAVPVITMTSAAANVTAISGGILVFDDPMPGDVLGIVVQCLAFLLVVGAAALMPAPRVAAAH